MKSKIIIYLGISLIMFGMTGCVNPFQPQPSAKNAIAMKQPSSLYYDFGDVLIPRELKVLQKDSFIYRTGGYASGVMVLQGRVELSSLINFFASNMTKDNWRLISTFKSPRTLMLFQKENRWCIINITEGGFSFPTEIIIWIAPAQTESHQPSQQTPNFSPETLMN